MGGREGDTTYPMVMATQLCLISEQRHDSIFQVSALTTGQRKPILFHVPTLKYLIII